jgi:hypothetical protein
MPITAFVIQPVKVKGQIVVPLGTELQGDIVRVRRIGLGFGSETALVQMRWEQMRLPDGGWQRANLRVSVVDNSRESVDPNGAIHGIRATASASKVMSGAAISAASLDPMSLLFGLSASLSAFRIPESEIILPTGTELTLETATPFTILQSFPEPPTFAPDKTAELGELVHRLPYRTQTESKHEPSDITSIMFLGEESAILRAIEAAGWSRSDTLNAQSTYGTMRSVVENQGYKEGPVSSLVLNGQRPVGAWSKTLDTFFARHHFRLYSQDAHFDGAPVFVTSATHDSGIGINKATKTLIHIVDENIDEEREKIVYDMLLTGCVDGVQYVDRPWIPQDLQNSTGDTLRTDRRMAVLKIDECSTPRRADEVDPELKEVRQTGSLAHRATRNTFLYLRDDFYRGNIGYQAYSVGKIGWQMAHKKKADPAADKTPVVLNVLGQSYTVVHRPRIKLLSTGDELREPAAKAPSFHLPGGSKSYKTTLEYSISGGYSRFANRLFSIQPVTVFDVPSASSLLQVNFVQQLHSGYVIAPRATLNSWKYVSNEFGYTYIKAPVRITAYYDTGDPPDILDDAAQIRQFSYNTLIHARPNGARFRPYIAIGPVLQLLRPYDSSQSRKNRVLQFVAKDLGLLVDAYNFGHTPPLDGGGIFQFGLQYGVGYKYQLTPRFFIRSDFRETLSAQPDYWSKSYPELQAESDPDGIVFLPGRQMRGGPLRQRMFTTGFGVSF